MKAVDPCPSPGVLWFHPRNGMQLGASGTRSIVPPAYQTTMVEVSFNGQGCTLAIFFLYYSLTSFSGATATVTLLRKLVPHSPIPPTPSTHTNSHFSSAW